jgi:molybdopterin converting factor small subunit
VTNKSSETFYDEILCKDIKVMIEMIASLSNSYRLLVGGAEELSHIALVHKRDAEEAIERADELGEVIDDLERELKKLIRLYLGELMCKIEVQQLYNSKFSSFDGSKLVVKELVEDLENKYERNGFDNK